MTQRGNPKLRTIRRDERHAERIVSVLFPRDTDRNLALGILADSIACATRVAPTSWGTSLFPQRVCLNVGRGAVLQLYPGEILFIVTERLFNTLPAATRRMFKINGNYKFIPDALEGRLSAANLSRYDSFRSAHTDLIERAATNRKTCFWPYSHASSVVKLLRSVGHIVPKSKCTTASDSPNGRRPTLRDLDELDRDTLEGRRILRQHLIIERDPQLASRKKDAVLRATGRLACEVCFFTFEEVYGSLGHGFAEVHHLRALAESKRARLTNLEQLAVVCSNCHRMLHRGNPVFTLEELRARLTGTSATTTPNQAVGSDGEYGEADEEIVSGII